MNEFINRFKIPNRKEYYKKFEGNIPRNTEIPDGRFEVTVNYNSETKKMKVTQILHNGSKIAIREGFTSLNYNILEDYFQSVYDVVITDRSQYTINNIIPLEKLKGRYEDSILQIKEKVNILIDSISISRSSSFYAMFQRLFADGKKVDLSEDINKFNASVQLFAIGRDEENKKKLMTGFKTYYDETMKPLIEKVNALLEVKDRVEYAEDVMNQLICILEQVIISINLYKLNTISMEKFNAFKDRQKPETKK